MDKHEVLELFDYLYWVNHKLLDAAARLSNDEFIAPTTVTSRGLRATLVHELDVEWSWRLNVQGKSLEEWGPDEELKPDDYPDVVALNEHWLRDEAEMRAWLGSLTDEGINAGVSSAFTANRRPLRQYLLHIVMHAAQQQADAATLLTIAGASPGEIGYLEYLHDRKGAP